MLFHFSCTNGLITMYWTCVAKHSGLNSYEGKKTRRGGEAQKKGIKKCQIRKRKENINYFRKRLFTGENWEELKLLKSQNTEHRFLFPHNGALRELTELYCNNRHEKLHWKQPNYILFFRRKTFLKLLSAMQMTLITWP